MLQSNLIFSPQASKSNVFWSLQINHNEFYGWLRIDPGAVSQQIFMATSLHMLVISTNAPRKFSLKVTLMRAIQGLTIAEKQRSRCFADVLADVALMLPCLVVLLLKLRSHSLQLLRLRRLLEQGDAELIAWTWVGMAVASSSHRKCSLHKIRHPYFCTSFSSLVCRCMREQAMWLSSNWEDIDILKLLLEEQQSPY